MDSPFPGMDPYLERHWQPVHVQLVSGASRLLNRRLPADLVARPEERLAVEVDAGGPMFMRRTVLPVARVFEPSASDVGGTATLIAPFKLVLESEPVKERFVRILTAAGERLVTVIEFVSPTNKIGEGLDTFVAKRDEMLDAGVNWVEIDLVRRGNWRRLLAPYACPADGVPEYRATVRLAAEPAAVYVYPLPLRCPLPPVPIPLRATDAELPLDVQRLVSDAYVDDRYGETLNYTTPLDPPLAPDDAAWADALLRAAGRR
jgi:hypothetical protein